MLTNIKKKDHCVATNIENSMIILNINSGKYFEINKTGMLIWELLDKFESLEDILNFIEN